MKSTSFQRRVQSWRLQRGADKEVYFEQEHLPGKVMKLDWTNANELKVTIQGRPLEHLLCRTKAAAVPIYCGYKPTGVPHHSTFIRTKQPLNSL